MQGGLGAGLGPGQLFTFDSITFYPMSHCLANVKCDKTEIKVMSTINPCIDMMKLIITLLYDRLIM